MLTLRNNYYQFSVNNFTKYKDLASYNQHMIRYVTDYHKFKIMIILLF